MPVEVLTDVAGISLGSSTTLRGAHTCAIKTDGALYCWGLNDAGQVGNQTKYSQLMPAQILINITSASFESSYICAVNSDKDLYCWGMNDYG